MSVFAARLSGLQQAAGISALRDMRRGIEKESLRVTPDGLLAQTPHPQALGSAFKHANITTDFSEALLEFITPACNTVDETLAWLHSIHAYTYSVLSAQQERLWVSSMPCVLSADSDIPLAQYGSTHTARMKTIYREGLGHRYGRLMQTIAGIHYNVSFPDSFWLVLQQVEQDTGSLQAFKTQRYFDLIRNFRRHLWLLLFLFGASPALCPSFVKGREHGLQPFGEKNNSLHLPFATSLRMGDLGYQSNAQSGLMVCYNGLPSYIHTLKKGLTTPYPAYEAIGVCDTSGHYRQLSTNLLQIENEFYSTIRPKRVAAPGETPILALHERGVEYIEVRCLDLDPYLPVGIDSDTAHFIEAFLLWCLLSDSPLTDEEEYFRLARNQRAIVERGRDPGLQLESSAGLRSVVEWAQLFMAEINVCAEQLDAAYDGEAYSRSVINQQQKLDDSRRTTAAHLLQQMAQQHKSFFQLVNELSSQHAAYFSAHSLPDAQRQYFIEAAALSLQKQRELEAAVPQKTFAEYLAAYYAQYDRV